MNSKQKKETTIQDNKKIFVRKPEDLLLKAQLLISPNAFIEESKVDKQSLKIKLMGGVEFDISEYVAENMAVHETKFFKEWFYRLAYLVGVDKSVMDVYVKPDFVRRFIIQFVYGRFPYLLLRTLRSRNRKIKMKGRLFQHLKKGASDRLDEVIEEVFTVMQNSDNIAEFKLQYSKLYNMYFQLELFS